MTVRGYGWAHWRRSWWSTSSTSYLQRLPRTRRAGISLAFLILTIVRTETPSTRASSLVETSLGMVAPVIVLGAVAIDSVVIGLSMVMAPYLRPPIGRAPPDSPRR